MESKLFPVQALNKNITDILKSIISADIQNCVKLGLSNEVSFIDVGTNITCPAKIIPDYTTRGCKVELSAAYCQYLWLTCDIALKSIDVSIIKQECDKEKLNLEEFKKITEQIQQIPIEKVRKLIQQNNPQIDADKYLAYICRMKDLLNEEELSNQLKIENELIMQLIGKSANINLERFNQINLHGKYEEIVNSVYCYGIAFILLHELSHFNLGHLNKQNEELEDERDADISAFWNIYNDLDAEIRFTANCGILCTLFSLLYLNPNMEEDGIHPREDYRIMEIYEQIKDDNNKYTFLVVYMFKCWSIMYNIKGFPNIVSDTAEDAIERIKSFLSNYPCKG